MIEGYHFGRAWNGHQIEDECPCRQAACGLVDSDPALACSQHSPFAMKTMRQAHDATHCPAKDAL